MNIRSVEFKNFASYGDKTQTIDFAKKTGNFYLILGKNGAGKSTISDVIKFALYGKLYNKKLGDIPNRFNKSAWCRIVIQKDKFTTVTIERGIAPGILKCMVNDIEYDKAGKKNIQEYIEEEVIGMPFYVFNNIVSLSVNDFKSFLNMRSADKRGIIDKIFNLEVINRVKALIKKEVRETNNEVIGLSKEVELLINSINTSETELTNLTDKLAKRSLNKIEELTDNITKLSDTINNADERLDEILNKETNLKDRLSDLNKAENEYKLTIRQSEAQEGLYLNKQCPTCEADLTSDDHVSKHNEILETKKNAIDKLNESNVSSDKFRNLQTKISSAKLKINEQRITAQTSVNHYRLLLKSANAVISDDVAVSLKNIISKSSTKLSQVKSKRLSHERKGNFYKVLENIFGDKGVKQLAIKRILPPLNKEINRVLGELNIEHQVLFNEEFEATIIHIGHVVTPESLSTGERKKVDFGVLVALIKMMKLKFHGLNLIFLDEIFSSIDTDGIYQILKLLSTTCKDLDLNIFVINHSQLPIEIFDYKVEITKEKGFSDMLIEKIE